MASLMATEAVVAQSKRARKMPYEEVDFENMVKRYFGKESGHSIEGIYKVSCVITKRSRKFLSKAEKFRVVGRQDNYAKVAVMKDWPESNRDFIEVSLSYRQANRFPIVGEMNILGEHNGFIYNHIEPDGTRITFSMALDSTDLLEGEYSEIKGRKTITYRLSYLKIYPKVSDVTVYNH